MRHRPLAPQTFAERCDLAKPAGSLTPVFNPGPTLHQVDIEREKYSRQTQTQEALPMSQPFQVISTFSLDVEEAAYKIIFEIPSPIGQSPSRTATGTSA